MNPKRASQKSTATSASDSELFRAAIGPVRELGLDGDPLRATRPLPEPLPVQSLADEKQVLRELLSDDEALLGVASGEVLAHLQDGYPPKLLRQLRRGQFVIEAELDLHHLRVHQARSVLGSFLLQARRDRVLRQRSEVIGYVSARPQEGGTGAVLVLLQAPSKR